MSSTSEPPYPPGPYPPGPYPPGRPAQPAALPGRRQVRALPAAPSSGAADPADDALDDTTIKRPALPQPTTQADASAYSYQSPGAAAGGPQDPGAWFNRTNAAPPGDQGQGQTWQNSPGQNFPGPAGGWAG